MLFIASLSYRFPAIYNTAFVYWYPSLVQQAYEYQQIFRQGGGENRQTYHAVRGRFLNITPNYLKELTRQYKGATRENF